MIERIAGGQPAGAEYCPETTPVESDGAWDISCGWVGPRIHDDDAPVAGGWVVVSIPCFLPDKVVEGWEGCYRRHVTLIGSLGVGKLAAKEMVGDLVQE